MDFTRPLQTLTPTLDGDVLVVLARVDGELSGRQVHRLVGHSSEQGVRKSLERLAEQGVVLAREAGRAKLYQLNRQHLVAPYVERLAAVRSELIERLRETVAEWTVQPAVVLLFGSVARGEARPASDLDLLVIRPAGSEADEPSWREQLDQIATMATAWTGNDTRVLEYSEDELRSDIGQEPVFAEAVRDGIEIAGSRRRLAGLVRGPS